MRALALIVTMAAVTGQSGAAALAGVWTAQFEGKTFIRLELKSANGALNGALSTGDIEINEQGALRRVGEMPRTATPIFDVSYTGSTLRFSRKDSTEIERFELELLQGGDAELRFLLDERMRKELAAEGVPAPKPIRLTKK